MAMADWIKEAEEQAKKYSEAIKVNNQYLIEQLNQAKNNSLAQLQQQQQSALEQLQKQQDNAIYNLNSTQSSINQTAQDNAKQLNINRLLSLKNNQEALNRAGLGTQGIVGSQVNSINNNYGTNLTDVLNQKTTDLNNLVLAKNNTNMQYDTNKINLGNEYATNRLNLENEYGNNIASLQRQIDEQAMNQYNNIYQNYLALKQQEYENEQARLAQEEAKRQWQAEYNLAKRASSGSSGSGGYRSSSSSSATFTDNNQSANSVDAYGNSSDIQNRSDYYFQDKAGLAEKHPQYINNTKVSSVGKVKDIYSTVPSNIKKGQNIWTANGRYYVWAKTSETSGQYIDVTNDYKYSKSKKVCLDWRD